MGMNLRTLMLEISDQTVLALGIVLLTGYLLGKIHIFGISFGGAGILISALFFGNLGLTLDGAIQDLGLACFVTSVGLSAGPDFFQNFKHNFKSYFILAISIVGIGVLCCIGAIQFLEIPKDLAVGLFSGALTSTPGLGAALEASGSKVAAVGYGVAYPFGVMCVVAFVQIIPRILKIDLNQEPTLSAPCQGDQDFDKGRCIDKHGLAVFAAITLLGTLIAKISIPLPGGNSVSLGMSGGLLLAGILASRVTHVGNWNVHVPTKTRECLKEVGMILFLAAAGTEAGSGFLQILREQGVKLFIIGSMMTLLPMLFGFILSRKLFHMTLKNSLGAICGGMTSTPALGSLMNLTDSSDVVVSYVSTYPIALLSMVLFSHWIIDFMP